MKYLKFLSQQKGWAWEFECHNEFSADLLKNASAVKVESSLSEIILPQLKVFPTQVRNLEILDSMFIENGHWCPRLMFYEILRLFLVKEAPKLDIRNPVFIVGEKKEIRVLVSVLAEMGFSDFYIVGDENKLTLEKQFLLSKLWGLEIKVLPPEDITMQALSAGLILNTANLSENKDFLVDLSYFNFMKHDGYVLDLGSDFGFNLFLEEAEKAGLKVLSSHHVMHFQVKLWLDKLEMNISDYEIKNSYAMFLKEISSSV
ncbi:MAG: hypothetical protein ACXVCP_05455 [Bdellovibrio sp.]